MKNSLTFTITDSFNIGGLDDVVMYGKFYVTFTDMKGNVYTSNELIETKSMSDANGNVTLELDNLVYNKEYIKYYELWLKSVYSTKGIISPETDFTIVGKIYNSSTSNFATKVYELRLDYTKNVISVGDTGEIGELKLDKEQFPVILTSINNNLDIVKLKENFKEAEKNFLMYRQEFTNNLKNVSIDTSEIFERVASYEPTSWVYVITRFLELIDGTINPALRFTKNGSMDLEFKRLTMIQKTIENLLNLYPDITITDGEGMPYVSSVNEWTYFSHSANGSEVDQIDSNISLTRGLDGGLYNPIFESYWNSDRLGVEIPLDNHAKKMGYTEWNETPVGTYWNSDGGDVFGNFTQTHFYDRTYIGFRSSLGNQIGNNILIKPLVMWDTLNDKFHQFIFITWGSGDGGSFSYFRRELVDPNYRGNLIPAEKQ